MKNKNNIFIKIEKISNYNPKIFYNLFFKDKIDNKVLKNTLEILKESANNEDFFPDINQVKQIILKTCSSLPTLEMELEENKIELNNKETLKLVKKINDIIYFIFLYFYINDFEKDYDVLKNYFE